MAHADANIFIKDLKVGDFIPGGEYKGKIFNLLEVVEMEPNRAMLWVFLKGTPWEGATWSWGLYKIDEERTRLVSRLRQKYTFGSLQQVISWSLIDAIEILMMRGERVTQLPKNELLNQLALIDTISFAVFGKLAITL